MQIYRGRLYLWHYDGRLSVYDWERLIALAYPKASRSFAVRAAWLRGDSLYQPDVLAVFDDPGFRKALDANFAELRAETPVITPNLLNCALYVEQDNPVKELPTDTEIYNNVLYLVTYDGFWSAKTHSKHLRNPVSSRPQRRWDAPVYSASASHRRMALSAGDEGLFDYDLRSRDHRPKGGNVYSPRSIYNNDSVNRLTVRHSSYADWASASVYSTSLVGESCLLAFRRQRDPAGPGRFRREFVREINESEILQTGRATGLSWGAGDKICDLADGYLTVTRYVQQNVTNLGTAPPVPRRDSSKFVVADSVAVDDNPLDLKEEPFRSVGTIPIGIKGDIVKAGVAHFGILLETNDQLLVYRSDNGFGKFPGPIVRWRTYSRAKYYENHLHIVGEDAVHIVAFMHDYWQNQEEKIAGIRYRHEDRQRHSAS